MADDLIARTPVVAEIRDRCEEAGLAPPSHLTVARRIPALFGAEEIAKKRSANPKHLYRLKGRPGYIHAAYPLDVCQIDHTPTDINFVEVVDGGGTFVGRAYLTLVTDVATRCILGFCLTLEKPSELSVALCLAQAMCPKEEWLTARGIEHGWPMFGRPRSLVTDSEKEFKGNAFQRGCEDYGIRIRYRDRGRVHHGGVVERLLGKLNGVLATQPGSTGRSVANRDQYPAERRARLSFADLEQCVVLAVIDHNLQQNARTLKVPASDGTGRRTTLRVSTMMPCGYCWHSCPEWSAASHRRASACSHSTITHLGWASLFRSEIGWASSSFDTILATSAMSMPAIPKPGSFDPWSGATACLLR